MDRQFLKLVWGVSFLIGISLFSACQDKDYYDPKYNPDNVGDNPSTLNFLTTKEVTMDFNYKVIKGFRSKYDIYTEPPLMEDGTLRSDVAPVASGIAISGEMVTRVIPAYATDLYLYSAGLFVPTLSYAKVENGRAVFSQIDAISGQNNVNRSTRSIGGKNIDKYLKVPGDFYAATTTDHYKNDLIAPDKVEVIPGEVLTAISATFPEGTPEGAMADPKYYTDATIEIKNDGGAGRGARVYVSVIHAAGQLNNSLSYFTYRGGKAFKDFSDEEKKQLKVINIFEYANVYTNSIQNNNDGLTPGKYVQLLYIDEQGEPSEFFPVGSKIGWILHSGAYNNNISNNINTSKDWMYSTPEWNLTSIKGSRDRTIFFETKHNGVTYNCFGFEDCPGWDNDCNDIIFRVLTDPEDAILPPPSIEVEDIEYDEEKKGVLAFEDLWPAMGDYDLNDVVVKYHSTITYTQKAKKDQNGNFLEHGNTYVSKLKDKFSLIYSGANYRNSFCYKMDLNPSIIKSINIENQPYTLIEDGDGFIIELCPLVSDLDGPGGAIIPYDYKTTPKEYTVEIEFDEEKLLEKDFVSATAPYNPFIVPQVDKNLRLEVHLPNYPPTTRVDYNFFNTEDDRSDKDKGLWYVSGEYNPYSFAIHLANAYDDFVIPREGKLITETYPEYKSWVESGMTENLQWYLHPKQ